MSIIADGPTSTGSHSGLRASDPHISRLIASDASGFTVIDTHTHFRMSLTKGQHYTWSEIVDATGSDGSPPYFLLHRDGKIGAGCFTLHLNLEAPVVGKNVIG